MSKNFWNNNFNFYPHLSKFRRIFSRWGSIWGILWEDYYYCLEIREDSFVEDWSWRSFERIIIIIIIVVVVILVIIVYIYCAFREYLNFYRNSNFNFCTDCRSIFQSVNLWRVPQIYIWDRDPNPSSIHASPSNWIGQSAFGLPIV